MDLPNSKGIDSIFVVVDCLTKMLHFIPCSKIVTRKETAKLFLDNIYCIHGLFDKLCLIEVQSLYQTFGEDYSKCLG